MGGQIAAILKRSIGRKSNANSLNSRGQRDSEPILEWNGPRKVTFGRDLETINRKASIYQSCESFRRPDPRLSIIKKFASFYTAPITKFWAWALFFHIFLLAFSNVLVVEMQAKPTRTEWLLVAYMGVFGMEHLRKLLALDLTWKESFRVFFNRYWNLFTTIAILFFSIGFAFRMSSDPYTRKLYGRSMLCLSNVLWHVKTLEYLSINPLLGTYIHMGAKMVVAMSYIVILLIVSMAAFGVTKQAIHEPRSEWEWLAIRNIFYQPYFMLYGEVYAGDIDRCNDEGINCVPGNWIPPVIMVIFLLVSNILLINMLIAIFNNIFNDAITKSQEIYLFERYQQVLEYTDTPLLPPPFTLLPLIYRALARIWRSCKKSRARLQHKSAGPVNSVMKSFLDDDGMRRVHDFEEDCMDDMMRERKRREKETHEVTLRHNAEQIEAISQKMHEMSIEAVQLRYRLVEMEKLIEKSIRIRNPSAARQDHNNRYELMPSSSSHSLPDTNVSLSTGIASIKRPKTPPRRCEFDSITEGMPLTFTVPENQRQNSLYGNHKQRRRQRLHSSSISINADISEMEKTLRL